MQTSEQATEQTADVPDFVGRATYCPEDNKLRLYIGRVPRDEFLKLRAEGWTTLHKQREAGGGDFVAVWTPWRRDRAIELCGLIEDEDMGPEERAADRAERFAGYRDKRADDAGAHADRFDTQPSAHGFQNQARAERAAARHDRIGGRAVDAWDKAEYWQRRTAGVISHRLHLSSPSVRMGRIKELEAAIRKAEKEFEDRARNWRNWCKLRDISDPAKQTATVRDYVGSTNQWADYKHPRADKLSEYYQKNEVSLYSLATHETDPLTGAELCALFFSNHREPKIENDEWLTHYRLRLAYETQMLEAQGGRAGVVEMEVGGLFRGRVIVKIHKSNASGRVTSVDFLRPKIVGKDDWTARSNVAGTDYSLGCYKTERASPDDYQPPTEESRAQLAAFEAQRLAAAKKRKETETPCPLVNPTDADAQRLQDAWNARAIEQRNAHHEAKYWPAFVPSTVLRLTQAQYSANASGAYARLETRELCQNAELKELDHGMYSGSLEARNAKRGTPLCKIRVGESSGAQWPYPKRVIVLTDKPQKALPAAVWEPFTPAPKVETQSALSLT